MDTSIQSEFYLTLYKVDTLVKKDTSLHSGFLIHLCKTVTSFSSVLESV